VLSFASITMPVLAHWASSRTAADALAVSERTLHRWRAAGLLKPGIHWRRKFPAANSPLLYDLEAVEALMREAAARSPHLLELAP
jgi:predicted site-specific integrase-resolvase